MTIDLASEKIESSESDGAQSEVGLNQDQQSQDSPDVDEGANADIAGSSTGSFGRNTGDSAIETPKNQKNKEREPQKMGGALAGGVTGGVIALLVAGGLYFGGVLPSTQKDAPDHAPAISALQTQLTELRQQLAEASTSQHDNAQFSERLAQAENQVGDLASSVENLQNVIASLEERSVGDPSVPVDLSPIDMRISQIEAALSALQGENESRADLPKIESDVAALREQFTASQQAQDNLANRLSSIEEELSSLSGRMDEQAKTPATAVIIAASALKAAIDRGGSFSAELNTFSAVAPNSPEVEALSVYADSGVATRVQLVTESDTAANAMIAAARPVATDASVVDRLWESAKGLVQVRPVGMVEGEGVPETVARLEAAINAGDFARALAEYGTLPEAAKTAGAAFMERVRARHEADQLIDEALASALKA